jgi:hypothetical protein
LSFAETASPWDIVPSVTDQWKLAAFALAVVFFIVLKFRGNRIPLAAWVVISLLVIIPIGASIYQDMIKAKSGGDGIYRVRVTVVDPQGTPTEEAKVWSSFDFIPKKVAGGWQVDIPAGAKPKEGSLTIFASRESAFLTGTASLDLKDDPNPAVIIRLSRDTSAKVRGQVVDGKNHAVVGARVFVIGYESEAVITKEGGNFELPAHAALNQPILLHAEKSGYPAVKLWHPAGDAPAVLSLTR